VFKSQQKNMKAVLVLLVIAVAVQARLLKPKDPNPVNVELYFESYCPSCIQWLTGQLYPTWQNNGMAAIMNITIYPYGNAQESYDGSQWQFTCQHGDQECQGNIILTCAIRLNPDVKQWLPFANCMEGGNDPVSSAQGCAQQTNLDWSRINECTTSSQGNQWEHEMAQATDNLDPPHQYTPWVMVNGAHSTDAENQLQPVVCAAWQGAPPPACSSAKKCMRDE